MQTKTEQEKALLKMTAEMNDREKLDLLNCAKGIKENVIIKSGICLILNVFSGELNRLWTYLKIIILIVL